MRKKRSIIALAVVLALMLGAYVFLRNRPPKETEPDTTPAVEISKFERQKIVRMTVTNENGELEFVKKTVKGEDGEDITEWEITKPYSITIVQSKVEDLARTFSALTAEALVEENAQELEKYGLKDPAGTGEAELDDGSKVVLYLGSKTAAGNTYYLMKEGDPNVYAVWMNHGSRLSSKLSEYRDKSLPKINVQEMQYLFMSRPGLKDIELVTNDDIGEDQAQYGLSIFSMVKPYSQPMGVSGDKVAPIMDAIPALTIKDFAEDNPEDLSKYGLDEPSYRLIVKDKENTLDLSFGSEFENGKEIYFMAAGSDSVYTMDKSLLEFMNTKPLDIVERFAFIVNIDHVDKVEIEGFGRKHIISMTRRTEKSEEEGKEDEVITTYFADGKEMEEKPFKRYYQALIGLMIDSEKVSEPEGEPEVRTTFYLNRENNRVIVVEYIPYDKDFYQIVRDGKSEFLISRHRINRMFEELDLLLSGETPED